MTDTHKDLRQKAEATEVNKRRDELAHAYYRREKVCDDDETAFIAGWDARTKEIDSLKSQLARVEAENVGMREALRRIRNDSNLWKSGGRGGQDRYAGLPPAMRIIDQALSPDSGRKILEELRVKVETGSRDPSLSSVIRILKVIPVKFEKLAGLEPIDPERSEAK